MLRSDSGSAGAARAAGTARSTTRSARGATCPAGRSTRATRGSTRAARASGARASGGRRPPTAGAAQASRNARRMVALETLWAADVGVRAQEVLVGAHQIAGAVFIAIQRAAAPAFFLVAAGAGYEGGRREQRGGDGGLNPPCLHAGGSTTDPRAWHARRLKPPRVRSFRRSCR